MRKAAALFVWLSLVGLTLPVQAAPGRAPMVVELYTSQGCLACEAAGEAVGALADRKDLIVLSFSVDYWDIFGWKDSFAQPGFTDRQRDYATRFGKLNPRDAAPVTPQVVIQGRWQVAGGGAEDIAALISTATKTPYSPPQMILTDSTVRVGSGRAARADVWLVRYDPREQVTRVRGGENCGQVFRQRNVVTQLTKLGTWSGGSKKFTLPPAEGPGLGTVVLLQGSGGGQIIGAVAAAPKP